MIHSIQSSSRQETNDCEAIWFEVKCNDNEESREAESVVEFKNITEESAQNAGWLPDRIEKNGNWFLFDTHFGNDSHDKENSEKETIQILCCNLTQPENCNNPTMLFHIDYWKKQLARKVK